MSKKLNSRNFKQKKTALHVTSPQASSKITAPEPAPGPVFRKEFESKLSPETLRHFKQYFNSDWAGNPSFTKLFEFWKSLNPEEQVDDQLLSNSPSSETAQHIVQDLVELLHDDKETSLHQLGDSTLINNINDDGNFGLFSIAKDGFSELVSSAENNESMITDNSNESHIKSADQIIETILEAKLTVKLTSSSKPCCSNSADNNTTNKIPILKIEYLEPANLPNDSVNDNNFLTPPSQTLSVKSDVNHATVNAKENIPLNINLHTPPNQTPSVKSDFVDPPFSEVCPEPCSSQSPLSYFRTPPKFPTPFKNAFYFPKKPQQNAKKRVTKKITPIVAIADEFVEYQRQLEAEKFSKEEKKKERLTKKNAKKIKTAIPKKLNGKKTKEVDQEQINQEHRKQKKHKLIKNMKTAKDEQVESECKKDSGYQKDDYVIIIYENKYFRGQVIDRDKTKFFIKAMERIGIHWRWPTIEDVIWYEEDKIVSCISAPRLINKRGFYSVPEIKDMD
ncbi:hypothetical protein JTB14_029054 [Gonioctena quinquepunctata]|nr:hypothetical protein JTB14_029054 [Gonioctena quinquepunctata]